jgi:hypothetical protein
MPTAVTLTAAATSISAHTLELALALPAMVAWCWFRSGDWRRPG